MLRRVLRWCGVVLWLPVAVWSQTLDTRHAGILDPLTYGSSCTSATLNAAIAAAPVTKRVLILTPVTRAPASAPCTWAITTNVTVPATMALWVPTAVQQS